MEEDGAPSSSSKSEKKNEVRKSRSKFNLLRSPSTNSGDEWSTLGSAKLDTSEDSSKGLQRSATQVFDIQKIWKSPYLKSLVRRGIPDIHRPGVWANIVGVTEALAANPNMYQTALRTIFGEKAPQKFYRVPNFGGPSFDLLCDSHALSPEGHESAQRILVVLAMENPDIQFCPTLPDLVQLLLRYLPEPEAYVASKLLLDRSVHSPKKAYGVQYFAGSFKGTLASCRVFDLLVKQFIPRLHASLKKRELSVGVMLYHKWFNRLFVDIVPMKTVLRIFDSYLLEGLKGIFRIGLAILKHCEEDLVKCNNDQEFSAVLSSFYYFGFDDALFDDAHAIPLRRAALTTLYLQSYQKLGAIKEPFAHVYYRPKNLQSSHNIAEDEFELLWTWLPPALRIRDPHLEFTSSEHGFSLQYMLSKIEHFEKTLFVIRSTENRVFGFFASSPWNTARCQFFGERESFVFTMRPSPDHYLWTPGHANDRMQYVTEKAISLGAGPPAIALHDDLTITSHACPTFQSPPLGLLSNFGALCVEVYSIH
eukprot:Phypoly_transcript_04813.p1 GENE.Phypoly_transcript_04813~~Phypoly_transcript_04813.p1  ORF type:complete len:535 (+),score=80.26 Phypoly_transcript_04813:413-2017(+)